MSDDTQPDKLAPFYGVMTCGACPVQYEGRVAGHQWYFRSRGEHFSLRVASTTTDEQFAGVDGDEILSGEIDSPFLAGYMPYELAVELIHWGLSNWKPPAATGEVPNAP